MEVADYLVVLMLATFIGLLLAGIHVAFALTGCAVIFTGVGYLSDIYLDTITGLDFLFISIVVDRIYSLMANWILVAGPMFIFMGLMLESSGIAEKLLVSAQELFGGVRGGLAVTVITIGILLAASTGIIGASVVLLGVVSLPTMLKQGYSKYLAVGTIASSGTLGILIPPSIMLVFMADQLSLPVGDLFLGAFIPGIILGTMYILYVLILSFLKPDVAPLDPNRRGISLRTILIVMRDVIPPAVLIILVLGSIFAGIATVTEASGMGALGAMLIALFNRRLSLSVLKDALHKTTSTLGFVVAILIGASAFALVLRGLGGDEFIEEMITSLPVGPWGIVFFILFCVFLLGFFLDWIEITFIVLPLIGPIVGNLGLEVNGFGVIENPSLVWFAVLTAVVLQTAFLTPPMGPALFFLKGVCPPEISMADMFKGIIPFVVIQVIAILIVFFWPELVTWLPAWAYG